jgi:hypothetical protein
VVTWWEAVKTAFLMWFTVLEQEIRKPTWAAGLAQTILGTGIAFVGALLLLRRQLKHDRHLNQVQIEAVRKEREAEQRAKASRALGQALIAAVVEWHTFKFAVAAQSRECPGAASMWAALSAAHLTLDLDEAVGDLWARRRIAWEALEILAANVTKGEVVRPDALRLLRRTMRLLLAEDNEYAEQLGQAFVRWNGIGTPPGLHIFEDYPFDNAMSFYPKARDIFNRLAQESDHQRGLLKSQGATDA